MADQWELGKALRTSKASTTYGVIAGRLNRIQASTQVNEDVAATWNEDLALRRPQEELFQVGTLVAEDALRDEAPPDLSYTDGSQCICLWLA